MVFSGAPWRHTTCADAHLYQMWSCTMIEESSTPEPSRIRVAVVHVPDGVRFVAASASAAGLRDEIARYVGREASRQLTTLEAARVDDLLARGAARLLGS